MIRLQRILWNRHFKPIIIIIFIIILWLIWLSLPIPPLQVVIVGGDGMQGIQKRGKVLEEGKGCTFPKLEQNGAELMKFIETAKPLECSKNAEKNWVTIDDKGNLKLRSDRKDAKCTLTYFDSKNDEENKELGSESVKDGEKMKHDFAKVKCIYKRWEWTGLLASVAKKESVMKRIEAKSDSRSSEVPRLSVAMFGIDSMSQQHFRRKLPETVMQLNKMGAVIFNGYNIVGDGTPAAFIPILTGKTELELPNTRKRFTDSKYLDEAYPLAFNNFSDAGYATLFGEDMSLYGTFNYRLKGFKRPPTDHYMRSYFKELEAFESKVIIDCVGSEPLHKIWFDYAQQFLREYRDVDRFLLMHEGELSHDDINLVEVEDKDFAHSLESMENEGLLDDVVLFVFADHGHRFTKIRDTQQGQLEEAGVEAHWCTCLNWQSATATEDDRAQTERIANGLVTAINSRLTNFTHLCAEVTLDHVISAQKFAPNDGLRKYKSVKDDDGYDPLFEGEATASSAHYKVKITTNPNSAVYEATMFFDGPKNELEVDLRSISHVNPYGNDPHCVIADNFSLGPFCVCHDKVRTK